ncbi:histidine triad nucleotide-binding protein [bacterium]|nr:histidine triad nucleotide-binding protein [bacterium]
MDNCIFCKITEKKIPSKILFEDEICIIFEDITPQAPIHILAIPKLHVEKVSDVKETDKSMLGHLICKLNHVARDKKINDDGYRIVINCGEDGGQAVNHLHVHLLGGRLMQWPPG